MVFLDLRVKGEGLVSVARRCVRSCALVERTREQVAVASLAAVGDGLIEERGRPLALPLLPDRLGCVEAQLAQDGLVDAWRGQGGAEGRLGLRVLVGIEEDHAAREQIVDAASNERSGFGGRRGLGQVLQTLAGTGGPVLSGRLGPHLAIGRRDLLQRPAELAQGLGALEHGLRAAWPFGKTGQEGGRLGVHLGPAFGRHEGVHLDHHGLSLGHAACGHARKPGKGPVAVAPAQAAAGRLVGMVRSKQRVGRPELLENVARGLPRRLVQERERLQEKQGIALRGFGREIGKHASQLLTGADEIAGAKVRGGFVLRAGAKEWFEPLLVECNRGRLAAGRGLDGRSLLLVLVGIPRFAGKRDDWHREQRKLGKHGK